MWTGLALILVGLLLPWVETSSVLGDQSQSGWERTEGKINLGIGIVSAILGYLAWKQQTAQRFEAILRLVASAAICGMAASVLGDLEEAHAFMARMGNLMAGFRAHVQSGVGIPVSIAGGITLAISGVMGLRRNATDASSSRAHLLAVGGCAVLSTACIAMWYTGREASPASNATSTA